MARVVFPLETSLVLWDSILIAKASNKIEKPDKKVKESKVIFPMHERKKEENYKEFAAELKNLGVTIPVIFPEKRGDRFSFRNGIVQQPQTASR